MFPEPRKLPGEQLSGFGAAVVVFLFVRGLPRRRLCEGGSIRNLPRRSEIRLVGCLERELPLAVSMLPDQTA